MRPISEENTLTIEKHCSIVPALLNSVYNFCTHILFSTSLALILGSLSQNASHIYIDYTIPQVKTPINRQFKTIWKQHAALLSCNVIMPFIKNTKTVSYMVNTFLVHQNSESSISSLHNIL